ncbi:hypothetical protein AHF37_09052 [Paragonimus kellicotti]|nr:hypothetical protein AHF37_09052 [Paragonimus kellicotti]
MESPMGQLHIPQDLKHEDCSPESSVKSGCISLENGEVDVGALSSHESDTISSDKRSNSSSLSDFMPIELPVDVPDGLEFRDLSLYLDKVTTSASAGVVLGNLCAGDGKSTEQQASQTKKQATSVKLNDCEVDDSSKFTQICVDVQPVPSAKNSADSGSFSSDGVQHSRHNALRSPDLTLNDQASHVSCDDALLSTPQSVKAGHFPELEDFAHFSTCDCSNTDSACWPVFTSENPVCEKFASFTDAFPNVESKGNSDHFCPSELATISGPTNVIDLHVDRDNEGDDEFGDFTGSSVLPGSVLIHEDAATSDELIQPPGFLKRLLSHLEPALGRTFGQAACGRVDCWLSDLSAAWSVAEPSLNDQQNSSSDPIGTNGCLWKKVLPLRRIPDLRYHWSSSVIYKAYLHSLNVDASHAVSFDDDVIPW